jgi:hypothetical protein
MTQEMDGSKLAEPQIPHAAVAQFEVGRRAVLRMLSGVLAGITLPEASVGVSVASLGVASAGYHENRDWIAEQRQRVLVEAEERAAAAALERTRHQAEQRAIIENWLFGEAGATQYYIPGTNNPYSGITGVTPHVGYAMEKIIAKLGFTGDTVHRVDELQTPRIDGSVLLLGGPVPNLYSRQIMGVGAGSPIFTKAAGRTVELPISFRNILVSEPKVGQRPRYQLVLQGKPLGDIGTGGSDYLVLTSIPNIFSNAYGSFNHRIFIASGLHGGGMRAIHLLLEEPGVLQDIIARTRDHHGHEQGWQAVIRVDKVDLSAGIAGELRERRVFPLPIDFGKARKMFEKKAFWIDPADKLLRT